VYLVVEHMFMCPRPCDINMIPRVTLDAFLSNIIPKQRPTDYGTKIPRHY